MEETLGMMTAITEQTRNSNKSARGLNTIFNNLAQVLDEASSNGKKITAIFDDLGISMYDLNTGQLLSSYELLTKLNEKWDTLDTNTKNYIASTIAGETMPLQGEYAGTYLELYIPNYNRNIVVA